MTPIDYGKVALGSDVLFVGYPNDFYDELNNLPLVRKGTLASMPNIDFNGKGQIAIDAQVFYRVKWKSCVCRLGWQNIDSLESISDTMEGRTPSGAPAVLGIGILVKQRHVQELIDHAVNQVKQAWGITTGDRGSL